MQNDECGIELSDPDFGDLTCTKAKGHTDVLHSNGSISWSAGPQELVGVDVGGTIHKVDSQYENVKAFTGGIIDLVRVSEDLALFVHDEGLYVPLPLNIPASLLAGRVLCGPVVVLAAEPDDLGNTVAPDPNSPALQVLVKLAGLWRQVVTNGSGMGRIALTLPYPVLDKTDMSAIMQVMTFEEWEQQDAHTGD